MSASLVEVTFEGYDFAEPDTEELAKAFAAVGPTYSSGGWASAATPPASVEVVITFLGQTVLGLLAEKALQTAWRQTVAACERYRIMRSARGGQDPELSRFAIRAVDFELVINGVLDPSTDGVAELLALLAQRRESGKLSGFPLRRIMTPCIRIEGEWEVLDRHAYVTDGDFTVWYVESRVAEPDSAFYDARNDTWLPPT